MNPNDIRTCVLCGRRGVKDFVLQEHEFSGTEPERTEWLCANREACERRQRDTFAEKAEPSTGATEPNGAASAAAVAGLAREVEALRKALNPLKPLPKQLDDLANLVHRLAEDFAAQAALRSPAGAPSWLDLPADLRTALSVLEDLTGWLREVYLRYADAARSLPACWMWHPDVVEELLWLMHAWLTAYRAEGATVQLAGDWHDRYRPGVVNRIKDTAGKCSLANHQPRAGERLPGGPVVPLAEALEPIAVWWATHRRDTPPEPDADHIDAEARLPRRGGGRR